MGLGDLWNRTLVYFGIAEEYDDAWDDDGYVTGEELEQTYAERPSANVRRLTPRGRRDEYDDWTVSESNVLPDAPADTIVRRPGRDLESRREARRESSSKRESGTRARPRSIEAVPSPATAQVHLVLPRSFNDAQQIADKFKDSIPVILNLQSSDTDLSKRLIDFASGLTYALDGGMQRIADKVFMLTPRNVEISAEERARLIEKGFFNQS